MRMDYSEEAPRWPVWCSWSALVGLGVIVYELTAQTGLAAAVACSKFGWNDFLTARWLRRTDPDRPRGRAVGRFHLAFGLWKITAAAFLAGLLIVTINDYLLLCFRRARAPLGLSDTFAGVTVVTGGGFVLALLATPVAFWCAWFGGQTIWLSLGTHRDRREDQWPPSSVGRNWADDILALTGWVTLLGTFLGCIGLAVLLVRQPHDYLWPICFFLLIVGHYTFGVTVGKRWIEDVVARTPADSWPPDEPVNQRP